MEVALPVTGSTPAADSASVMATAPLERICRAVTPKAGSRKTMV